VRFVVQLYDVNNRTDMSLLASITTYNYKPLLSSPPPRDSTLLYHMLGNLITLTSAAAVSRRSTINFHPAVEQSYQCSKFKSDISFEVYCKIDVSYA